MKTVSFAFCRTLSVTQSGTSTDSSRERQPSSSVQSYTYVETMTVGWRQGSRTRIKRFQNLDKAYEYVNKLHAHGYLSDESYDDAWLLLDNLPRRFVRTVE